MFPIFIERRFVHPPPTIKFLNIKMQFIPDSWIIGDLYVNPRGAKSASIHCENLDHPPQFRFGTPGNPIFSPYGAASWEATTRETIDFSMTNELQDFGNRLDLWAKDVLFQNPKLFTKPQTKESIDQIYQSCIKTHEKNGTRFPDTIRCKFNTNGHQKIRFWDASHNEINQPELKFTKVSALVQIKGFWFANNSVGLTLQVSDMMCFDTEQKCPF